eukprot:6515516-Alexandrium_andersonii.AAC.1
MLVLGARIIEYLLGLIVSSSCSQPGRPPEGDTEVARRARPVQWSFREVIRGRRGPSVWGKHGGDAEVVQQHCSSV